MASRGSASACCLELSQTCNIPRWGHHPPASFDRYLSTCSRSSCTALLASSTFSPGFPPSNVSRPVKSQPLDSVHTSPFRLLSLFLRGPPCLLQLPFKPQPKTVINPVTTFPHTSVHTSPVRLLSLFLCSAPCLLQLPFKLLVGGIHLHRPTPTKCRLLDVCHAHQLIPRRPYKAKRTASTYRYCSLTPSFEQC